MPREKYRGVWIETIDLGQEAGNALCEWCGSKPPSYMIGVDTQITSSRVKICDSCGVMVQLFVDKSQGEALRSFTLNQDGTRTGRFRSDRPNRSNVPRPMHVEPKVDILYYGDTLVVSPKNSCDAFEEYDDGSAEADEIAKAVRQGHTTVISRFPLNVQIIRRP